MEAMRKVGRRSADGPAVAEQGPLARTAAALRGTAALVPRGVYRFKDFDEADRWMTSTMRRTHARLSHRTSSGSARP